MSNFSKSLKMLRSKYCLTQRELAAKLNVTQNAIHQWENEKREPSTEMIEKIAKNFNISPAQLMGWEGNKGLNYTVSDNIAKLRKSLRISQEDLAGYTNIPLDTIINIELVETMPTADELIKIAEALMVSVDDLLELPGLTPEEAYKPFIHDMFRRNGYFISEVTDGNGTKYWISNDTLFYEIDKSSFNSFTTSIDDYFSFALQKMLNNFHPEQLRKKN